MCLGVPGKVVAVDRSDLGLIQGKVEFGGIQRQVNLTFTPEVEPGDWVVVHVGFAISKIDEHEAQETFRYLEELGEVADLHTPLGVVRSDPSAAS